MVANEGIATEEITPHDSHLWAALSPLEHNLSAEMLDSSSKELINLAVTIGGIDELKVFIGSSNL